MASSSSNTSQESDDEAPYTYQEVSTGNFCASSYEKVLLASLSNRPWDNVAIRIKYGSAGYVEWLNELQVYLLPNFKHKNILQFYGAEEFHNNESSKFSKLGKYIRFLDKTDPRVVECIEVAVIPEPKARVPIVRFEFPDDEPESEPQTKTIGPFRVEYWLMTRFCDSMTLRDYLIANTLTWPQMINITKGIMKGLYFLHENHEYQNFDEDNAIDAFIKSTNGALKRIAFKDFNVIHMKPQFNLTVIHRNLCSKNIVLKRDFTPCIWNFANAYIHHPFQPTNQRQLIDADTKKRHLLSHYSAPEVLQEKGHLTLASMKSIDMYASGIIMWELISRCVLPKLKPLNSQERRDREQPEPYREPLVREFGHLKDDHKFTDYVVCRKKVRPRIKVGWLVGKKTFRYVQTMRNLWDPDYDARLHPATVIDRMKQTSLTDFDRRNRYFFPPGRPFEAKSVTWPDKKVEAGSQAPLPTKCGGTKVTNDYSDLPPNRRPHWLSSDSEPDEPDHQCIDAEHAHPLLINYERMRAHRIKSQSRSRRRQVRFSNLVLASSTPKESFEHLPDVTTSTVDNSFEMISLSTTQT